MRSKNGTRISNLIGDSVSEARRLALPGECVRSSLGTYLGTLADLLALV